MNKNLVRLNKFLANAGIASRRAVEQFILAGNVSVNGEIIRELGTKVDPEKDEVEYRGKKVEGSDEKTLILLNKPKGYVCTTRSFKDEKSIMDLIDLEQRVYPVGRLDKQSQGLVLLTNDGDLALKMSHPRYEKEKEYEVTVNKEITKDALDKLAKGVKIDVGTTYPAKVRQTSDTGFNIIIHEGKNRQIRKMCSVLGYLVVKLKRIRINDIKLGNLKKGKYKIIKSANL
jgi:23S rRNA pseudouridine2605 synthase